LAFWFHSSRSCARCDTFTRFLAFSLVVGRFAATALPAGFAHLGAQVNLFQYANDLAFTEFRFPHAEAALHGVSTFAWLRFWRWLYPESVPKMFCTVRGQVCVKRAIG
jgi:hypothetical protein